MKRTQLLQLCVLVLLAAFNIDAQPTKTNDEKFGKLPPNPISTWELSGVRTEIALDHFIDRSLLKDKLPQGFRPVTAAELGKNDPVIAKWLETHPKYSGYAWATLLFSSLDLTIGGAKVSRHSPAMFSDWWVMGTTSAPLDKFVIEKAALQLSSWFPDRGVNRKRAGSDPTVEFAKVEVEINKPGEWRVHLKINGGEITATCREIGGRTEANYPLPAFTTVFLGGPNTSKYTVYTYYGHYSVDVQADWKFTGNHPLISSLTDMKENDFPMRTNMVDSWRARAGIYRLSK